MPTQWQWPESAPRALRHREAGVPGIEQLDELTVGLPVTTLLDLAVDPEEPDPGLHGDVWGGVVRTAGALIRQDEVASDHGRLARSEGLVRFDVAVVDVRSIPRRSDRQAWNR